MTRLLDGDEVRTEEFAMVVEASLPAFSLLAADWSARETGPEILVRTVDLPVAADQRMQALMGLASDPIRRSLQAMLGRVITFSCGFELGQMLYFYERILMLADQLDAGASIAIYPRRPSEPAQREELLMGLADLRLRACLRERHGVEVGFRYPKLLAATSTANVGSEVWLEMFTPRAQLLFQTPDD
jgi:hypothetical protein